MAVAAVAGLPNAQSTAGVAINGVSYALHQRVGAREAKLALSDPSVTIPEPAYQMRFQVLRDGWIGSRVALVVVNAQRVQVSRSLRPQRFNTASGIPLRLLVGPCGQWAQCIPVLRRFP